MRAPEVSKPTKPLIGGELDEIGASDDEAGRLGCVEVLAGVADEVGAGAMEAPQVVDGVGEAGGVDDDGLPAACATSTTVSMGGVPGALLWAK